MKDPKRFYVYALLDPRTKGKFKYGQFEFTHQPFYIGKGCGRRCDHHVRLYHQRGRGALKSDFAVYSQYRMYCKIRKIHRKCGVLPIVEIVVGGLEEAVAFAGERLVIEAIGREDLKAGPLINGHDGGRGGSSNQKFNRATLKLIGIRAKESHAKRSESDSIILNQRIADSNKKTWNDLPEREKERRRNNRRTVFARKSEAEMKVIRKRMSDGRKRYYANLSEEERLAKNEKLRIAASIGWEKRRRNSINQSY